MPPAGGHRPVECDRDRPKATQTAGFGGSCGRPRVEVWGRGAGCVCLSVTVCLVLVLPRTVCHVPGRFVAGGHGVSGSGRGSVWVGMGSVATGTGACVVTDWTVTGFRSWRGGGQTEAQSRC